MSNLIMSDSSLLAFKSAGAECETAEFGAYSAIRKAAEFYKTEFGLVSGSVLSFTDWNNSSEPFRVGYAESYIKRWKAGKNKKPDADTLKRADDAARKAVSKVRQWLQNIEGVQFAKSETPDAKKKQEQREQRQAQDVEFVQHIRARAKAQGIDELMAAVEIGQGNAAKTGRALAALERVQRIEARDSKEKHAAEIKSLKEQIREKIKDASVETLRAMMAA